MNRFIMNLKIKIVLLCLIVMSGIFFVIHLTTYMTTNAEIEQRLIISTRGIAVALAHYITLNIEPYIEFMETRDVDSEYYKMMQEYFQKVKADGGITYIYTERRIDADTVEFILDAEEIGSKNYSPPGSLDINESQKEYIYETGEAVSYRFSEESVWGDLFVSYAPIYDKDGGIIGLLGVDIDIQEAHSQLERIQVIMIATYVLITLLVLTVLILYSNTFLETLLKDKLTGAFLKKYLDKLLKEEIRSARKDKRSDMAVMMLDIDYFKSVNDIYGHEFGDKVLRIVSKAIQENLRQEDYFIRYGGEEFIIIITKATVTQISETAENIRKSVEGLDVFCEAAHKQVKVTISIGIGCIDVECANIYDLIEQSDKALYLAKKSRNRVEFSTLK